MNKKSVLATTVIVTTSSFTDQAQLWAHDHNVKLVDGDDLVDMVRKHGREDLVDEYAPTLDEIESESESTTSSSSSSSSSESSSSSSSERDSMGIPLNSLEREVRHGVTLGPK